MIERWIKRAVAFVALTAASLVFMGGSAQAAEFYYFGGASFNETWPFCGNTTCYAPSDPSYRYVQESSARTINGNTVCAATFDTAVVCSNSLAVKSLCGCQLRDSYSRSTVGGAQPRGRAQTLY